jgi:cyanate lyase
MTREELTQKILAQKAKTGVKWADIAKRVGKSKEWTATAVMGQMAMKKDQAEAAAAALGLNLSQDEILMMTAVPYRGSIGQTVPTDPLIYRFYEIMQVFGASMKSMVEEEFGDGIMSAIDFKLSGEREPDPAGDRVKITYSGKFLPYKTY